MNTFIRIGLTFLLFGCLFSMPYGYYQFVRFSAMVGFGLLAFDSSQSDKRTAMVIYCALALLFQPFFSIALGRGLWNIVDVVVGIGLIASLIKNQTGDKY